MAVSNLEQVMCRCYGSAQTKRWVSRVWVDPAILSEAGPWISRATIAYALNLALIANLCVRAPSAAAYIEDVFAEGGQIHFDHGALRTVDLLGMGGLPRGSDAVTRLLLPLGYTQIGRYPLDGLAMTGWSYAHADFPATTPQFFVSELHVDRFPDVFQQAAKRVTASSVDPLPEFAISSLDRLKDERMLSLEQAVLLVPALAACFDRHHDHPSVDDYETLLSYSAEMAWIATEGNAFNHATDRVRSVREILAFQRARGRRVKDDVEISGSGRVRQSALRADPILRRFLTPDGTLVERFVPGSFFEFIERDLEPETGRLDLAFDSSNAQGIFAMTSAHSAS